MARCRFLDGPLQRLLLAAALCGLPIVAPSLRLKVVVHYPEKDSAVDRCDFKFQVATSFGDPNVAVPAGRAAPDTFTAELELPDSHLHTDGEVAVMASFSASSEKCLEVCPRMGPQGKAVMYGPFPRTGPLGPVNRIEVWPTFCEFSWSGHNVSFFSAAIGRQVHVLARVPGAFKENSLPRPSSELPPLMFRLNSEWYWPDNGGVYHTWNDLMNAGRLHYFIVAEVYIEGLTWQSWDDEPIFTSERLHHSCEAKNRSVCDDETQFVCDSWEQAAYVTYTGGRHRFGVAAAFYDELYDEGLPGVFRHLPDRTDDGVLRVGVWGYCIGGLGAWSAMLTRPARFNLGYLGSPAVDFDCGDPLRAADTYNAGASPVRPKIYIDSGAAEGPVMNNMSLLLFQKLQRRGLVEGEDVFYERAPFGTHQGRSLLRRAHAGVLALFGVKGRGRNSLGSEVLPRAPTSGAALWPALLAAAAAAVGCFALGRRSAAPDGSTGAGQPGQPLLAA